MFDTVWIGDLDGDTACAAITSTQDQLRTHEWTELALAAHWAVLHDGDTLRARTGTRAGSAGAGGSADPVLAGTERSVRVGGHGTPRITEFAAAELGLLMGTGFIAASSLLRDAVDLQHRHPQMWATLAGGKGRVWKARQVARMVHAAGLTRDQARYVDTATTAFVDTLTWSAFTRLVEAKIIEADPDAAEARRLTAAMARFVTTGQSNEHGLKTLIARAGAGEIIYFVAVCDRLAQILRLDGDPDSLEVRRSRALAILANPTHALALLEKHASTAPHPDDPDPHPDQPHQADQSDQSDQSDRTDQPDQPDPACAGPGNTCASCGGPRIDPAKLRPRAVLYVRISEQALRTGHGAAHGENGIGPLPIPALRDLLAHHHVTIRPVLDLAGQAPIDAYEIPHDLRQALRLARPTSVFPWTRTGTSTPDIDHTIPYQPVADGGPPGQTRTGNLGPMVRFAHRIKTHGRGWQHSQPSPGTYLWRTPHHYWYRVDNDGTKPLGRDPDLTGYQAAEAEHSAPTADPPPGLLD